MSKEMNYEVVENMQEVVENVKGAGVLCESTKQIDSGMLGKIGFVIGMAAVGVTVLAYKNKAKIEAYRINKLRNKGYLIYTPEEIQEAEGRFQTALKDDETNE